MKDEDSNSGVGKWRDLDCDEELVQSVDSYNGLVRNQIEKELPFLARTCLHRIVYLISLKQVTYRGRGPLTTILCMSSTYLPHLNSESNLVFSAHIVLNQKTVKVLDNIFVCTNLNRQKKAMLKNIIVTFLVFTLERFSTSFRTLSKSSLGWILICFRAKVLWSNLFSTLKTFPKWPVQLWWHKCS